MRARTLGHKLNVSRSPQCLPSPGCCGLKSDIADFTMNVVRSLQQTWLTHSCCELGKSRSRPPPCQLIGFLEKSRICTQGGQAFKQERLFTLSHEQLLGEIFDGTIFVKEPHRANLSNAGNAG